MAAPTYQDSIELYNNSTASQSLTSSGLTWSNGSLVIIAANTNNATSGLAITAGWTEIMTPTTSNTETAAIWYRVMQTGDTLPTISQTTAAKMNIVAVSVNAGTFDTTTPISVGVIGSRGGVSSANCVAGAFSSASDQLVFGYFGEKSTTATSVTLPTSMNTLNATATKDGQSFGTGSGGVSSVICTRTITSGANFSSGELTATFNTSSGSGLALIFAVNPASATVNKNASDTANLTLGSSETASVSQNSTGVVIKGTAELAGASASSVTVPVSSATPATWSAGDIVIIGYTVNSDPTLATVNPPAGWTAAGNGEPLTYGNNAQAGVWWRKMQAGDANPVFTLTAGSGGTLTNSKTYSSVIVLDGNTVNTTNPIAVLGTVGNRSGGSASTVAGAFTTNVANQECFGFYFEKSSTAAAVVTAPTSSTILAGASGFNTGAGEVSSNVFERAVGTTGTTFTSGELTATYDVSSGNAAAYWIGIQPPTASTPKSANDTVNLHFTETASTSNQSSGVIYKNQSFVAFPSGLSATVNLTGLWASGDVVLLGYVNNDVTPHQTLTAPAGWTAVNSSPIDINNGLAGLWYRKMVTGDSNPVFSVPTTGVKHSVSIMVIDGTSIDSNNPIAVAGAVGTRGGISGANVVAGAFTTTANSQECLGYYFERSSTATTVSTPTNANTTTASGFGAGAAEPSVNVFERAVATSGTAFTSGELTATYDVASSNGGGFWVGLSAFVAGTPKSASDTTLLTFAETASKQQMAGENGLIRNSFQAYQPSGTAITLTLGTGESTAGGWFPGDVTFIVVEENVSTLAVPPGTVTMPAGWTAVDTAPVANGSAGGGVWYRVMQTGDANPVINIGTTSGKIAVAAVVIDGNTVDNTAPIGVLGTSGNRSAVSTTTVAGAITTTQANQKVLGFWVEKSSTATTFTPPTNSSLVIDQFGTGAGAPSVSITKRDVASGTTIASGAETTVTYDSSSSSGYGVMIALRANTFFTVNGTDTINVTATESQTIGTITFTTSDATNLTFADTASVSSFPSVSDTTNLTFIESAVVPQIVGPVTDTTNLTFAEIAFAQTLSGGVLWNDTTALWNDTSGQWDAIGGVVPSVSDTTNLTFTEVATLGTIVIGVTDALFVTAADTATLSIIPKSAADITNLTFVETASAVASIPATDTTNLTFTESATAIQTSVTVVPVSDTISVHMDEVASIGTQVVGPVSDTTRLHFTETASVGKFTGVPVYAWSGTSWNLGTLRVWNGNAWTTRPMYMWNGTIWEAQ